MKGKTSKFIKHILNPGHAYGKTEHTFKCHENYTKQETNGYI